MDLLFLNVPRPYNRFPMGYRPLNRRLGTQAKSTFSLHLSENETDSIHHDPAMFVSHTTLTEIKNSGIPSSDYRRNGADPLMKVRSHLSLPTSPIHSMSSHDYMPPNDFHKWRDSQPNDLNCRFSSYPRDTLLVDRSHSKQFLRRLQLQKEKIENHECEKQLTGGLLYSYEIIDPVTRKKDSNVARRNEVSSPTKDHIQSYKVAPSHLHKTQSDSSIFHEVDPRISLTRNISTMSFSSATKENRRRYDRGGRHELSLNWRAPKEGFFALKHQQNPSWMTDPPPPFAFRENDTPSFMPTLVGKCNENSNVCQMPPTRLDETKLKLRDSHLIPEQTYSFVEPEFQVSNSERRGHISICTPQFPPEEIAHSHLSLRKWENMEILPPATNQEDSIFSVPKPEHNGLRPSFSYGSKPSCSNISIATVDSGPPSRLIQSSYHEYKSVNDLGENTVFAPTQSKVFTGFRNLDDKLHNIHFDHSNLKETQSVMNRPKEKTFAVVSRPQTPLASLQNVTDFTNPLYHPQPNYSPNVDEGRLLHDWSIMPPTSCEFSDNYTSSNRNVGSPMSSYDNGGEADFCPQSCSRPGLSNNYKKAGSTPAHGILVKNHEGGPRASKKVVFQCDSDGVDHRLLHCNGEFSYQISNRIFL